MTFFEVETGNQAVPNNIVDANELNDRFSAIVDSLQYNAYLGQAWMPMEIDGTTFEYNTANSITSDSNLTAVIQPRDKITFEQETDGEYFAFVTKIDWDTTVADKTYIELFVYEQNAIEDEDITGGTVGLSRAKNPWGWPKDIHLVHLSLSLTANQTITSGAINFDSFNAGTLFQFPYNTSTKTFTAPFDMTGIATVALRINSPSDNQRYGVQYAFTGTAGGTLLIQGAASGTNNQDLGSSLAFRMQRGDTLICNANFGASGTIDSSSSLSRLVIQGTAIGF